MSLGTYCLNISTQALFKEDGRQVFLMVPEGAAVQIDSKTLDDDGLVEVVWNDKIIMMFSQDLRSRAKPVNARAATAARL